MTEKTLLPIGSMLNLDGRDLKVVKRLTSGLTGEVYEGALTVPDSPTPIRVAMKVMKVLDFPMARQFFLQESETLAFLMHLEEEANKMQRLSLKIAPVYYGRGEYQGTPYLVEEFIPGEQVPSIMEKSGRLPEKQALTIAWHLYRTLDLLHTKLKKTYIDLKFEDLWWVNGENGEGQLKLTDFGTLEDIKDTQQRGVARDLLLSGVYLCSMLFGYTPNYSLGELREPVAPILKAKTEKELTKATTRQFLEMDDLESARRTLERFLSHSTDAGVEISWGARKLLHRLLHRNPASRPGSAVAVAIELRQLVIFWNQAEERLSAMALNNLTEAESAAEDARAKKQPMSQQGRDYAVRARSALDILHIQSPRRDISSELGRAENALAIGDYLERGLALLKGGSYAMSRQVFEEGIQWSDDPALFRRWAFWARVGEEIPPSTEMPFDEAEQVISSLTAGHWDSAAKQLTDMTPAFESKGLDYLKNEAAFFALLDQAEAARTKGDFGEAAKAYEQAQDALKKYPEADARFIREQEVGDFHHFIEEMQSLAASRQQAQKTFGDALAAVKQGNFEVVFDQCWQAYILDRGAPFRFPALNDIARLALKSAADDKSTFKPAVRAASRVASIGKMEAPMDGPLSQTWHLAQGLFEADAAVDVLDGEEFRRAVAQTYASAGQDALLQPLVTNLLDRAAQQGEKSASPVFMGVVGDLYQERFADEAAVTRCREKAKQLAEQQTGERHASIDHRLDQVMNILSPMAAEPGTLNKVLEQAVGAASLWRGVDLATLQDYVQRLETAAGILQELPPLISVDDYKLEDWKSWKDSLAKAQEQAKLALSVQEKSRRELRNLRIAYLSAEQRELEDYYRLVGKVAEVHADLDVQNGFQAKLYDRLADFQHLCYQLLADQPETDLQAAERQQKMEKYGIPSESMDDLGVVKGYAEWVAQALSSLGPKVLLRLKDDTEKRLQQLQADYEPARSAFKSGDLPRLSEELDKLEPTQKLSLEWQKLKQDLARVTAWKIWLKTQTDRLKQEKVDAGLLRDLRAFLCTDLPRQYWQDSPAPAYLQKANEMARKNFVQAAKSGQEEDFVAAVHDWLNADWTLRAENPSAQQKTGWNRDQWLKDVYRASKADMNKVPGFIMQVPEPENYVAGASLFSVTDWQDAKKAAEDEDRRKVNKEAERKKMLRQLLVGGSIVLVIALILGLAGFLVYRNWNSINQMIIGTYTPTPLAVTDTPVATPTLEAPTATPAPTAVPTPAISPTPLPSSGFVLAPEAFAGLYPAMPAAADAAWLFNVDARDNVTVNQWVTSTIPLSDRVTWLPTNVLDPSDPTASKNGGIGKRDFYTAIGDTTITWTMDQPFAAGTYAVYILDSIRFSAGSYSFAVSSTLNGKPPPEGQGIKLVRGQSSVIFQDADQKTDDWLSLGYYEVPGGQTMSVQVVLPKLTATTPFSLDRLLILKLSDTQVSMLTGTDQHGLPANRTLVSLMDDPKARFYETVPDTGTVQVRDRGNPFSDVPAWGGSFQSRTVTGSVNPIQVDWLSSGRLPAGDYNVWVWIPASHASAVVDFALLADTQIIQFTGDPVAGDTAPDAYLRRSINQGAKEIKGTWLSLGNWTLKSEAAVTVRMLVGAGASGDIGVDAVAIVAVGKGQ